MKLDELIDKLQRFREEHGNLRTEFVLTGYDERLRISSIEERHYDRHESDFIDAWCSVRMEEI